MMEKSFEEIAKKCYEDRVREKLYYQNSFDNQVKKEYVLFCWWCRGCKNGEITEKTFKEYQKKEKVELNFWTKKRIAELYFGYKCEYDHEKGEWEVKKV